MLTILTLARIITTLKCRAKTDTYITENTYEERSSVRYNAISIAPVDYVIHAKKLYQI
ncbi:hypothetical protein C2G38_2121746, partial [Gigaspora rosea]